LAGATTSVIRPYLGFEQEFPGEAMKTRMKVLLTLIAIGVILNAGAMVWVSLVTVATSYSAPAFIAYLILLSIDFIILVGIFLLIIAVIIDLIMALYARLTS
jgi:hypothetical protein